MVKTLVVGRNYANILSVARLLGEAGCSVEVLKVHKSRPKKLNFLRIMAPDKMSKYVDDYREIVATEEDLIETLLEMSNGAKLCETASLKSKNQKMLLLPVDDYSVYAVDEALDRLSGAFLVSSIGGKQGAVNEMMNKSKQKQVVEKILKAYTAEADNSKKTPEAEVRNTDAKSRRPMLLLNNQLIETGDEIPKNIVYPVFIKPNISMKATKAQLRKINDEEELKKVLSSFGEYSLLIEDYCDIKSEYSLIGFSTGTKAYAPAIFEAGLRGHKERKGVAATGKTVDIEKFAVVRKQCERVIEEIGYLGIFDIDIIEDNNGNIFFTEINFRAGASIYAFGGKSNLIGEYVKSVYNDTTPGEMKYKEGLTFVSEKVLMEEYVRGDISKKMFRELIKSADINFIKNDDDTAPFEEFKKYYFLADLLRLVYKFR